MKMLKKLTTVALIVMTIALIPVRLMATAATEPADLRCELRVNPVGIDVAQPRFSWKFKDSEVRGQGQSAYQILLASSEELLKKDKGDVWDSGKVTSADNIAIVYAGKVLLPEMWYHWKIKVWDQAGQAAEWSPAATFLTGKLSPENWSGKWIGPDVIKASAKKDPANPKPVHQHGAIYLRKEFALAKPAVRAVVSFSGLGFSELAIDGGKVGDYVIAPGFTDYNKRVQYLTFDVSDRFKTAGAKRLDVILTDGWYALKKDPWNHALERKSYNDLPKLILDLRLIHADGTETVVTSDESWRWSTGEITRGWIAGEDIDLRLAGEQNRDWKQVIPVKPPLGQLRHQKETFNRIIEEVKPVKMKYDPVKKSCVWDLGRTINGWVRFKAKGADGKELKIITVPRDRASVFTLAGTGDYELYEPRFFHSAIQQIRVDGLNSEPALTDLVVCQVSSMQTPIGGFSSSDETTNALHDMVRRTVVNYTTFLPNDPTREWKAWTQDIQSMFGTALYLFDESQVMYERWQYDMTDSQREDGNIANVAPGPVFDKYNSPWWGGCAVWLPWEWYLAYGDASLLKESYPAMKRYVDFLETEAAKTGGLQTWGLADWHAIEETPIALINTPAHYHYATVVSKTAEMLGRAEDAKKYAEMARQIKDTLNQGLLDPATGIYGEKGWTPRSGQYVGIRGTLDQLHSIGWSGDRACTQAGQVMPLALGMVPETARPAVERALLSEIHAHKDRLSTGFVSTPYLLDVLMDLDPETCWRMTTTREYPSWYFMTLGTRNDLLKETWAGGIAMMPSLGGNFARWCYRGLGGIRSDDAAPGFKKIIIKPAVVSGLTWVKSHHDSPYGRIVSNWKREGEQLTMEVTIPVNTTATVYIPTKDNNSVTESGKPASQSKGVKFLRMEGKAAVYEIGSGHYVFNTNPIANKAPARAGEAPVISLAGKWRFALDRENVGAEQRWFTKDLADTIQLPGNIEAQGYGDEITGETKWLSCFAAGIYWERATRYAKHREPGNFKFPFWWQPERYYMGQSWFQRDIEVPAAWRGRRLALMLERVHLQSQVWLDDRPLGKHDGLHVPHRYELGAELTPGKHRLTICVDNRLSFNLDGNGSHGLSDHTQGNWNGIVGRLELTATSPVWIDDAQAYPDVAARKTLMKVRLGNATGQPGSGTVRAGGVSAPVTWNADGGTAELVIPFGEKVERWDEFNPALQRVNVALEAGNFKDERTVTFGVRKIEASEDLFIINGRKSFLRGTHEGCVFPLTGYPPTDVDSWKRVISIAQSHGLNYMRFHSWCPPEAAFIAADELGFYLRPEMIWSLDLGKGTPVDDWMYRETDRIFREYGNHPSFILMAPSNEPFGAEKTPAFMRKWLAYAKTQDPRRLYTGNICFPRSPEDEFAVEGNARGASGWHGGDYRRGLEAVAAIKKGKGEGALLGKPILLHEMTQYQAYPNFDEIPKYTGNRKARFLEIYRDDLKASGMLDQAHDFLIASGKLQLLCIKEDTEAALRTRGYSGYELLSMTDFPGQGVSFCGPLDVFWDSKGYVTPEQYRRFCNTTVPLVRLTRETFTTDETLEVKAEIAHFGKDPLQAAVPEWRVLDAAGKQVAGAGETWPARTIDLGLGIGLGTIKLPLKDLQAPGQYRLVVGIKGTAFENDWNFWVYPAGSASGTASADGKPSVNNPVDSSSVTADEGANAVFGGTAVVALPSGPVAAPSVGVSASTKPAVSREVIERSVLISSALSPRVVAALNQGGRVLLSPSSRREIPPQFPNGVFQPVFWNRSVSNYGKGETLGLLCDPKHPALSQFPTSFHADWQWADLIQNSRWLVLDGLPAELRPIVQGIDYQYKNQRLAMVFECRVGPAGGKLLVCSADLQNDLDKRPVARQLRRSLIDYMAGDRFQPKVTLTVEQVRPICGRDPLPMPPCKVVADSDGGKEYDAAKAVDGDLSSNWNSAWAKDAGFPHHLSIEFQQAQTFAGIACVPSTHRGSNGWIRHYAVRVSDDGQTWTEIAKGEFAKDATEKVVTFAAPVTTRFLRLQALSAWDPKSPQAAMAELTLVPAKTKLAASGKAAEKSALVRELEAIFIDKPFTVIPDRVFNAADYGAHGDGKTINTEALQKTLDAAAAAGGGVVTLPPGLYPSGALFVKSNTELRLDEGVTIQAIQDNSHYPMVNTRIAGVEVQWPAALINVYEQKNVRITGKGIVDGNGKFWWLKLWGENRKSGYVGNYFPRGLWWAADYDCERVRAVVVWKSEDVLLKDFQVQRSGFWSVTLTYSDRVHVNGLVVRGNIGGHGPSVDGVNTDSSRNILIENCDIDCGDDNFGLKAGRDADGLRVNRPTENVVVRNSIARQGHGMVTVGSETSGGIRRVEVYGLKALGTSRGFRFKSGRTRGGVMEDIHYHDITMDKVGLFFEADLTWSQSIIPAKIPAEEITDRWRAITAPVVPPEHGIPVFRNITFSNITATRAGTAFKVDTFKIGADQKMPIHDLVWRNVRIEAAEGGYINNARNWNLSQLTLQTPKGKELVLSNCINVEIPSLPQADVVPSANTPTK